MSSLAIVRLDKMQGGGTRPACDVVQLQKRCAANGVTAGIEAIRCRVKEMTEHVAFGGEISSGMRIRWNISAHASCNFNPCRANGLNLVRIVGHQLQLANVEEPQDFYRERKIAQIHCVSKPEIGFNCVEPLILKLIGAEFLNQADAAAFLMLVDEHSSASLRDCAQGQMKLLITVTPHGVEDLSRHALRMNANKWRGAVDIAQNQGQYRLSRFSNCMRAGIGAFKGQQVEVRPTGWEDHICDFLQSHQRGRAPFMPFVLSIGALFIDPYGKRISPRKNVCRQNVLMPSFNCRKPGKWELRVLAVHIQRAELRLHYAQSARVREESMGRGANIRIHRSVVRRNW